MDCIAGWRFWLLSWRRRWIRNGKRVYGLDDVDFGNVYYERLRQLLGHDVAIEILTRDVVEIAGMSGVSFIIAQTWAFSSRRDGLEEHGNDLTKNRKDNGNCCGVGFS